VIGRLRSRLRGSGEAGYSLVEMLTVMIIMSIVFAGITTAFVAGSKAQAEQDRRFQAQVTTRLALDRIRRDIHCASDISPAPGSYPTNSVTLTIPAGCGGTVSWCTAAVAGSTTRYALYRQLGSTCGTSGTKVADYLVTSGGNVFLSFLHTAGCQCLASLQVDFQVSVKGTGIGAYDLTDTIFLRNSTRI